jgi:hypothetical protein
MASANCEFPSINRVAVDTQEIAAFKSESAFLVLATNLMIEVASYVCIGASLSSHPNGWDRDQAVVGGNMVRLYKLMSAFLDQSNQDRAETVTIVSRLMFETIVSIRYLAANLSPALVDSYFRESLRHERRLLDEVQENIKNRNGITLPIEDRILKSIDRAAKTVGIALETVNVKDKPQPWGGKNLRDKAKAVGLDHAYSTMFGVMSRNVHGNWHDLDQFHLTSNSNGFFHPKMDWKRPRPQIFFALCTVTLDAVRDFVRFIGGEPLLDDFSADLNDLEERIAVADQGHEDYLSRKSWPAI